MHVAMRHSRRSLARSCCRSRRLLNGIGYVEIARWNPTYASYQAVWFLMSAVALVVTLKLVRHVRDLDRYRYLTLLRRSASCS